MAENFKALDDDKLVYEYRNGNITAFNVLFERYFNQLYQYAFRQTQNSELSEELVMDLMLWLWTKRETIDVTGDMSSYLFKAIKNALFNHVRKKAIKSVSIELHDNDRRFVDTAADQTLAVKELREQYHLQIERLSPQRRLVFNLSREENLTYPQIAKQLNLSVKTVENHISSSLRSIRKNLAHYADLGVVLLVIKLIK
ncbi:RNA polymerase sigma-70 factor [Mucilaginibacter paludis]|uniref:RNA polymerase, sigma-24 subunit, ECF subfamily n=1 Tax=Mucilaginibacter paludis DSM 18603 TaxID=714943 RepID=H1Y9B0_9SPHI|nr:RNA polymerase sigma-70 factor [Mucilaginibacter paludis]EHQ29488.1 RNA polymerase, sigma-24 subunit, ECF subfamily [Mucilaginibacter paludis DSM 18603]